MAGNTSELSAQCIDPGYLREVVTNINPNENQNSTCNAKKERFLKQLPPDFKWLKIPKLSVITGVNGIGKTRLLHSILYAHPSRYKPEEHQVQIHLKFESESEKFRFFYQSTYDPESLPDWPVENFSTGKDHKTDLLDIEEFLTYLVEDVKNEPQRKALNTYLEGNAFHYKLFDFLMPSPSDGDSYGFQNNNVQFRQQSLTPGEQTHLFNLLINYEISRDSKRKNKFRNVVLLLDEPDAHLHPSLIPTLIDSVTKLITFYGMQVIMTTHKPITITLIKDKECLFHMKIDPTIKFLSIEPVLNRNHCIQLLTSNVVAINGNLRLIFVEAEDDKLFYETVNKQLIKQNQFLSDVQQLVFVCFDNNAKGSCRHAVEQLVEKLTNDSDSNLKDFVYGLIDNDNVGKQKNTARHNVITLERYSIENYVFDPINIFFYCFHDKRVQKPQEISTCWEQLQRTYEPHLSKEPICIREILEHQGLTCLKKQDIFQKIVNCVSTLFMVKLGEIINQVTDNIVSKKPSDKNDEDIYNYLLDVDGKRAQKLVDIRNNEIKLIEDDATVIIPIDTKQKIELQYRAVLLRMKGHLLVNVYQNKINRDFHWKHLFKFDKSFVKTQDIVIPEDLLLRLSYLHSSTPENHPAHQELQEMVSKNTNHFSTVNLNKSITSSGQVSASTTEMTATGRDNSFDTTIGSAFEVETTNDYTSSPGHLQELEIIEYLELREGKNLPKGFTWSNIPMLSVITGINGTGKTAVLHTILNYYLCSKEILSMEIGIKVKFRNSSVNQQFFLNSTLQLEPYLQDIVYKIESSNTKLGDMVVASYMGSVVYMASKSKDLISVTSEPSKFAKLYNDPHFLQDNRPWNPLATLTDVKHFVIHLIKKWQSTAECLNTFLKENQFKYQIRTLALQDDEDLCLNFETNPTADSISYNSLSSGDNVWLLNLLINYEISNFGSRREEFHGSILLLDEPDAHLHPSLIKTFFDTVTKYVNHYGIQVIMTTHSPETISLVPNVKCLFYMEQGKMIEEKTLLERTMTTEVYSIRGMIREVFIKSAKDKIYCMQLLTSNIVYVTEGFRMVFVETNNNKMYFEQINSYLIEHKLLADVKQLIFCLPVKSCQKNSSANNSVKKFNVRELISIFMRPYNDTTSLENFAYGIVQCRNAGESVPQNIQQLVRCAIENYILDPIYVFYYILSNDVIAKEIPDIIHAPRWEELASKCRSKSIHQILSEPDGTLIFQGIIDLMDELLSKNIGQKEENANVQISNTTIILKYPDYFIKKDHVTLKQAYTALHSQLNVENVFKFITERRDLIIPKDILEIFEYLHSPIPENRSQILSTTS